MFAIYIIIGVLIFFIVLLLIPVYISLDYEENLNVKVKYSFITFTLLPKSSIKKSKNNDKKIKKVDSEKLKPNDNSSKTNIIENIKNKNNTKLIKKFLKQCIYFFKKILNHITIDKLELDVAIVSEDAAKTALMYAIISSVVYPIIGFLKSNYKCKSFDCNLKPGFLLNKGYMYFHLHVNVMPIIFISYVIPFLINVYKLIIDIKKSDNK